jgi:hypothetical protein
MSVVRCPWSVVSGQPQAAIDVILSQPIADNGPIWLRVSLAPA